MSEPVAAQCTLRRGLRIERADVSAWRSLAEFHYRDHRCGAVDKVFAIRRADDGAGGEWRRLIGRSDRPVGVIVYSMPVPNVALRNRATNDRYVHGNDRKASLRLLNQEVRCISRVVIAPQYRGIGLSGWLVAETLGQAGVVLVEALAVMGRVHPFFVQAGMKRYDGPIAARLVRLAEAFGHVGIGTDRFHDADRLIGAIDRLGANEQRFVLGEIRRFTAGYRHGDKIKTLRQSAGFVVSRISGNPVYFLWRRP